MEKLLPLLPYLAFLACPVGMGLMMWLMMRDKDKDRAAGAHKPLSPPAAPRARTPINDRQSAAQAAFSSAEASEAPSAAKAKGFTIGGLCLNPKVLAGIALVALGIWAVAPQVMWAALPLLVVLACPLSMLFMMRGMEGGHSNRQAAHLDPLSGQADGAAVRHDASQAPDDPLERLRGRLSSVQAEQQAIAREITRLEAARTGAARKARNGEDDGEPAASVTAVAEEPARMPT